MAKQRSKKCIYNGMEFDSLVERDFYKVLEKRQEKGEIFNLRIQEKYILQEGFRLNNGEKIQAITYSADQVWEDKEGVTHICDTKGSEFNIEQTFLVKYKMLKNLHRDFIYHIVIRYDGIWYDLLNKESKKLYKEAKAIKKAEKELKSKKKKIMKK